MDALIAALDLGGTTFKAGLAECNDPLSYRALGSIDTPRHDPTSTRTSVERFGEALDTLLGLIDRSHPLVELCALGVSTRCPFTQDERGRLLAPGSFEIFDLDSARPSFPIEQHLRFRLSPEHPEAVRLSIAHDAVANLAAEMTFGAAKDCARVGLLIVGTGIGFTAVVDGRPTIDDFGNSPEISKTWVEELGSNLTDSTNGRALQARFGRMPSDGDVEMALFATRYQASVLAPWLTKDRIDTLVLTGGVCEHLGECYRSALERELLRSCGYQVTVRNGHFGNNVGLIGAAVLASRSII